MKKISSAIVIFALVCIVLFAQDAMMINDSGNVGIGTDTPSEKLEVAGNIVAQGNIKAEVPIAGVTDPVLRDIIEALCPVGTILAYGGTTEPNGFLFCDGSAISRSLNAELFAVIGTNFGAGDGSNTFNLPDLRGIFLRGAGDRTIKSGVLPAIVRADGSVYDGGNVGAYQGDAMQAITGSFRTNRRDTGNNISNTEGVITVIDGPVTTIGIDSQGDPTTTHVVKFNSADSTSPHPAHTDPVETRPANLAVNYIIKY